MNLPRPESQFDYWTNVPNVFFDVILPRCDTKTWKVLCHFIRKLYGFHKDRDHISITQIEKSVGLSHATVSKAVNKLIAAKIIIITSEGNRQSKKCREYSLNYGEIDEPKV